MKIILANKFYYPRGGDCTCVINLENLLIEKGHQVAIFSMDYQENIDTKWSEYFPSEISFSSPGLSGKLKALDRIFSSKEVAEKFEQLIDDFKPDILHVNNIHSYISPLIIKIAKKRGIKVYWTLHDYKLICPNYTCLNSEGLCEKCIDNRLNVVKYSCMKAGRFASLLAYFEALYWDSTKLDKYVDAYICPSLFMAEMVQKKITNRRKFITLNNFVGNEFLIEDAEVSPSDYYCYVGRLSAEKGILSLLRAAIKVPYKLVVIGSGDIKDQLKKEYEGYDNICFLGHQTKEKVKELILNSKFSVIPSEWYENNPMSVIESLCLGVPVLGANIGGIPELINSKNGLLYHSGDVEDLASKIGQMYELPFDRTTISQQAKTKFSPDYHYERLMQIYNGKY